MEGLGGGVEAIAVTSLGAGGDKGETGWHLPLSLLALVLFVVFASSLSCLRFALALPLVMLKVLILTFLKFRSLV